MTDGEIMIDHLRMAVTSLNSEKPEHSKCSGFSGLLP